jgi:hypothetical protein
MNGQQRRTPNKEKLSSVSFVKCPSISTNSDKVKKKFLPIGSHIKVGGIKPYGFDYKIGDWENTII